MNTIQKWFQLFEDVSCFYREIFMLPLWKKYPNHATDIWDSLGIFLEGYAFERQGRSPDYAHAAVDALFSCKKDNGTFNQNVIVNIFQKFCQLLNNQNLNINNNCLNPKQNSQQNNSVIQVVLNKIMKSNLTLTSYLIKLINESNDIKPAFDLLISIRGIGDKIASFYLRDLIDAMNITLSNQTNQTNQIQNRNLLQPIDVWVERTVKFLYNLYNNQNISKNQIANWIVETSCQNNVNPERINMGIWFFCSNIVKSEYRLNATLGNPGNAQILVNDFRNSVRNVCQNCP